MWLSARVGGVYIEGCGRRGGLAMETSPIKLREPVCIGKTTWPAFSPWE